MRTLLLVLKLKGSFNRFKRQIGNIKNGYWLNYCREFSDLHEIFLLKA